MSNFKKIIAATCLSLTLGGVILPTISNTITYADENYIIDDLNTPKKLTKEQRLSLIKEIKEKYPSLSDYYIKDTLRRQQQGDYRLFADPFEKTDNETQFIDSTSLRFLGIWDEKGVTVDAMGASLDLAISALIGGGIASFVKKGRHEKISVVKRAIKQVLGNKLMFIPIDWILNFASPGQAIAEYWDAHDKYPNNGHINFEW